MSIRLAWTIYAACLTLAPLTAAAQSAEPAVDNPTRLGLTGTFAFDPQGSAGLPLGWGVYVERLLWRGLSGDVGYNSLRIGGNEGDHSSYITLMLGSGYHPWPTAALDPWVGVGIGWWHSASHIPPDAPGVEHVVDAVAARATVGITAAWTHGGVGLHYRLVKALTKEPNDTWSELGLHAEFRF